MPRTARVIEVGCPHHVTQRGNNRQTIFFDDQDRNVYLDLLCKYSQECMCLIHAFCLMENHIHLLVSPQGHSSLSKMMQKMNMTFAQYFNQKYNRSGHLWQSRFYSALIDSHAYLWSACKYIERNPVRANLIFDPLQYEWSSVKINAGLVIKSFIEPIWHEERERKGYVEFLMGKDCVEDLNRIEVIRKSTCAGKSTGDIERGTDPN